MKYINKILLTLFALFIPLVTLASSDAVSPEQIAGAVSVDAPKAKELFDEGVIFVDVRSDKDWNAGRVPDAEHLNIKTDFTEENLGKIFASKDDPMVIYCNGEKCLRSSKASKMAVDWGYTNVYYFRDGFPAWKSENYPVE